MAYNSSSNAWKSSREQCIDYFYGWFTLILYLYYFAATKYFSANIYSRLSRCHLPSTELIVLMYTIWSWSCTEQKKKNSLMGLLFKIKNWLLRSGCQQILYYIHLFLYFSLYTMFQHCCWTKHPCYFQQIVPTAISQLLLRHVKTH